MRLIISGGGTGGHIFPAISVADEIKKQYPNADILFIGAEDRMEMEKVPQAGYPIKGLPVIGIQRRLSLKNLSVPVKLWKSLKKTGRIMREFKPDAVLGFGGYTSAPTLWKATGLGIPTLIQEQNSYAGLTNKVLGKRVKSICVAFDGMEKFFPSEKIRITGNPVRSGLSDVTRLKEEALRFFDWGQNGKTLLIFGGSLGARTLNNAVASWIKSKDFDEDVQVIWQCGKRDYGLFKKDTALQKENVRILEFIDRMDLAYAIADLVVCRAGAITISELCIVKKPTILVPSPNVTDDHQTKNAMALIDKDAAVLVRDDKTEIEMMQKAMALLSDEQKLKTLSENIGKLARPNATKDIVDELHKLLKK